MIPRHRTFGYYSHHNTERKHNAICFLLLMATQIFRLEMISRAETLNGDLAAHLMHGVLGIDMKLDRTH